MRHIVELFRDDSGQDLIEYALVTTIVSAGGLVVMLLILFVMGNQYSLWQTQAQAAWEPAAPCGC